MKFLLVLEYLQCDLFLLRTPMIDATYHNAERPATQFLHDLIAVVELVPHFNPQIITIFTIEAIVICLLCRCTLCIGPICIGFLLCHWLWTLREIPIKHVCFAVRGEVHIIHYLEPLYLISFIGRQILSENFRRLGARHRELMRKCLYRRRIRRLGVAVSLLLIQLSHSVRSRQTCRFYRFDGIDVVYSVCIQN